MSNSLRDVEATSIDDGVASYNGSVSAEHGIGYAKTSALGYSKDQTSIELMKRIKKLFDPNGIMNPWKVLPE